jgi:hypothetical protein
MWELWTQREALSAYANLPNHIAKLKTVSFLGLQRRCVFRDPKISECQGGGCVLRAAARTCVGTPADASSWLLAAVVASGSQAVPRC